MAAIYVFLKRRSQNIRRNRVFRDRDNPLDYTDDADIISKYRLSRSLILNLCQMFQNDLQRPTMRSHAFPVSLQIMVALRFYATRKLSTSQCRRTYIIYQREAYQT